MENLRSILKEKSKEYYGRLKYLEKEADAILPEIRKLFPDYTNHDNLHKNGVEDILDNMLPIPVKLKLSPPEIFYLLVATWFHDIGMMLMDKKEEKIFSNLNKEKKDKFREDIREQHHMRSYNYIIQHYSDLKLEKYEADAIGNICKSHRAINIEKEVIDPIHGNKRIRLKFLGACLRLADECHITENRISRLTLKKIESRSWNYIKHFKKHELITGLIFNEDDDQKIKIYAYLESESDKEILDEIKGKIQKELEQVKKILKDHKVYLKFVILEENRNEIIQKKILVNLANGQKNVNDISSEIDETLNNVEMNLKPLIAAKTIKMEDSSYGLNENFDRFEELVKLFAGDQYNLEFVKSNYTQKMIDEKLISHLQNEYHIHYKRKEQKIRTEILKNSPTAINLSLNGRKLLSPYLDLSLIQGHIVLDQILLLGLAYDIYEYSQHLELDVKSIVSQITSETGNKISEDLRAYKKARDY